MAEARPCLGRRGIGARAMPNCPFAPEFANQGLQAYGPENFATCFTLTFPHRNITGTCNARGDGLAFFARPTAGRLGPLSTGRRNRMERSSTRLLTPLRNDTECRARNPAFVQELLECLHAKGLAPSRPPLSMVPCTPACATSRPVAASNPRSQLSAGRPFIASRRGETGRSPCPPCVGLPASRAVGDVCPPKRMACLPGLPFDAAHQTNLAGPIAASHGCRTHDAVLAAILRHRAGASHSPSMPPGGCLLPLAPITGNLMPERR